MHYFYYQIYIRGVILPFWVSLKADSCCRWCRGFGASARPSDRSLSARITYGPPALRDPHLRKTSPTCLQVARIRRQILSYESLPHAQTPDFLIQRDKHRFSQQNGAAGRRFARALAVGICAHARYTTRCLTAAILLHYIIYWSILCFLLNVESVLHLFLNVCMIHFLDSVWIFL